MIICHFFTRSVKTKNSPKRTYLMVDTSASAGTKPLFASPEILFEAVGDKSRWVTRAAQAILSRFPELIVGEACFPDDKRATKTQCFDIPFYEEKKGSLLSKLIH